MKKKKKEGGGKRKKNLIRIFISLQFPEKSTLSSKNGALLKTKLLFYDSLKSNKGLYEYLKEL